MLKNKTKSDIEWILISDYRKIAYCCSGQDCPHPPQDLHLAHCVFPHFILFKATLHATKVDFSIMTGCLLGTFTAALGKAYWPRAKGHKLTNSQTKNRHRIPKECPYSGAYLARGLGSTSRTGPTKINPSTKPFKLRFVGLTGITGAFLWYGKRKEYIPASQRHIDWYPTQDALPAQGA